MSNPLEVVRDWLAEAKLCTSMLAASILFVSTDASARPRTPWPPFPELDGASLFHEGFDWVHGTTNAEVTVPGYGTLRESWSGYALQRSGTVTAFIVPAVDAAGHTNVASHSQAAAVRFWLTPYWASQSAGGAGPGAGARLVELIAVGSKGAAVAWSLQVTPDGNALVLLDESGTGSAELLRVPIAWESTAHCIALNFGPSGTALFVDGQWLAQGEGTVAVPPTMAGLVFGSSWSGNASAEGDLEEIDVFGRWLTQQGMGFYFGVYHSRAALGPVSEAEWQAQREAMAKWKSEHPGGSEMMRLIGGTSECITNAPLYITNIFCTNISGQDWTVRFDVQGTNGPADIFTTTNFSGNSITNSQWIWLERGPTCSTYEYTNQPSARAFFVLGTPQDSDSDGLTDAYETLVSKTQTNVADSPRLIYEGVISNQNPSAWFKLNDSSFTNSVTSSQSLTNDGGLWDPDAFATGNNAFSFTNTSNSDRLTAGDVISGGDGSSKGSISLLFRSLTGGMPTARRWVFCQRGTTSSDTSYSGDEFSVFLEEDSPPASPPPANPGSLNVQIGGNMVELLSTNDMAFGAWYYLAITWNETNDVAPEVAWYLGRVGGTLTSGTINLTNSAVVGNGNTVHLGNRSGQNRSLRRSGDNGALDQIAFWNRELTNTEVWAQFDTLTPLFQGPSTVFDLSRWNLLLPVDKTNGLKTNNLALEISTGWLNSGFKYLNPTNWTQQYFYLSNGNTMVFEAPWNGARSDINDTNAGPRSELRGTKLDGNEDNWTLAGTNTLEATCAVHSAGTNNDRKVIIGQIHGKSPDVPTFTVNYNFPSIKDVSVSFKSNPSNGTDDKLILATNVNLLDSIHYKVQLRDNGATVILHGEGSTNGVSFPPPADKTLAFSATDAWHTATFYFKAGCYYPNNPTNGTAKVTFSSLSATRQ